MRIAIAGALALSATMSFKRPEPGATTLGPSA